MRALQPTRAASGAQRSDRAAHIIHHLRDACIICGAPPRDLSFTLAQAPARWFRKELWPASLHRRRGPGGAVLWFYRWREAEPLRHCVRSVLWFCSTALRVTCARVQARACEGGFVQNHRTIEPIIKNGGKEGLAAARPVLSRFYGSRSNKIGGGYPAGAGRHAQTADPHRLAGGAWRKFWGLVGANGQVRQLVGLVERIGGFLLVLGLALGGVGMVLSERMVETRGKTWFSGIRRKLSRLMQRRRGASAAAAGGASPQPARDLHWGLALTFGGISIDLLNRGSTRCEDQGGRGPNAKGIMGSGARASLGSGGGDRGDGGQAQLQRRVGDQAVFRGACERGLTTLWGGPGHVNG